MQDELRSGAATARVKLFELELAVVSSTSTNSLEALPFGRPSPPGLTDIEKTLTAFNDAAECG